jgi:hypothetical protein
MYSEAVKRAIKKYVSKNKEKHNEYQKLKQKEYYRSNPEYKLVKQRTYMKWKKISQIFRNILFLQN